MSEEMQLDPGPFKICLACTSTPVEGCESMTHEEVLAWIAANDERLEEPAECGDLRKYVVLSVDHN
jgi:hypothetical protein